MNEVSQLARKSLEYYLSLRYPVLLHLDEAGGYTAEIRELQGCLTQGETLEEVMENIQDAQTLWLETAYEYGDYIPLPSTQVQYSGKLLLRMPPSLHRKLAESSVLEGVSLNQYIVSLLSEGNALGKCLSTIIDLISSRTQVMKVHAKGIKKDQAIQLSKDIQEIPDGTEVIIEVAKLEDTPVEERKRLLKSIAGVWKNDAQIEEISASFNRERHSDEGKRGSLS